jgi:hypothetical protein
MHVLSDANGLLLLVGLSAANTHDSLALKPMIQPSVSTRTSTAFLGCENGCGKGV